MKTIGILLLIIGLGLTATTSITYFTKKKVVDIGNLEITHQKPSYITWSPLIGIPLIIGGVFAIWKSSRKTA